MPRRLNCLYSMHGKRRWIHRRKRTGDSSWTRPCKAAARGLRISENSHTKHIYDETTPLWKQRSKADELVTRTRAQEIVNLRFLGGRFAAKELATVVEPAHARQLLVASALVQRYIHRYRYRSGIPRALVYLSSENPYDMIYYNLTSRWFGFLYSKGNHWIDRLKGPGDSTSDRRHSRTALGLCVSEKHTDTLCI